MNYRQFLGHVLFWCVIVLMYAVSAWGYHDDFLEAILFELLYLPIRLLAVYVNWFYLIPRYLYKNHITRYLVLLACLLLVLAVAQRYFVQYWGFPAFFLEMSSSVPHSLQLFRVVQTMLMIISPLAISTGIRIFLEWYVQKNNAKQLVIEKREAELNYLKAQTNPHFLFNTLNNLYGLSMEQSTKVPELILKLSDFLSYSLYESRHDRVSVGKEVQLLRDYIALESDRYENRVDVSWDIDEMALDTELPSLFFMPLVENAFKHGVQEEIEKAHIQIRLALESDVLCFEVVNSMPVLESKAHTKGLGLTNLRRRLELLYPGQYTLETHEEQYQFVAQLKIWDNE